MHLFISSVQHRLVIIDYLYQDVVSIILLFQPISYKYPLQENEVHFKISGGQRIYSTGYSKETLRNEYNGNFDLFQKKLINDYNRNLDEATNAYSTIEQFININNVNSYNARNLIV